MQVQISQAETSYGSSVGVCLCASTDAQAGVPSLKIKNDNAG